MQIKIYTKIKTCKIKIHTNMQIKIKIGCAFIGHEKYANKNELTDK